MYGMKRKIKKKWAHILIPDCYPVPLLSKARIWRKGWYVCVQSKAIVRGTFSNSGILDFPIWVTFITPGFSFWLNGIFSTVVQNLYVMSVKIIGREENMVLVFSNLGLWVKLLTSVLHVSSWHVVRPLRSYPTRWKYQFMKWTALYCI